MRRGSLVTVRYTHEHLNGADMVLRIDQLDRSCQGLNVNTIDSHTSSTISPSLFIVAVCGKIRARFKHLQFTVITEKLVLPPQLWKLRLFCAFYIYCIPTIPRKGPIRLSARKPNPLVLNPCLFGRDLKL